VAHHLTAPAWCDSLMLASVRRGPLIRIRQSTQVA
jgi:hypothetical protein